MSGNHTPFSHGLSFPAPVPARTIKVPDHPEALSFQIRGAAPPCVFAVGRGELEPGVQREPLGAALCARGDMFPVLVHPRTYCSSRDLQRPVAGGEKEQSEDMESAGTETGWWGEVGLPSRWAGCPPARQT